MQNSLNPIKPTFIPKKAAAFIAGASLIGTVGLAALDSRNAFSQHQNMKSRAERVFASVESDSRRTASRDAQQLGARAEKKDAKPGQNDKKEDDHPGPGTIAWAVTMALAAGIVVIGTIGLAADAAIKFAKKAVKMVCGKEGSNS